MCLIMYREKDMAPVSREFYEDVWSRNNDGWGIMWVNSNKEIKVKKGLLFKDFWPMYRNLEASNVEMLVHFRFITAGHVTLDMCHPFKVTDDLYMMHNGTLDYPYKVAKDKSDSWAFANQIVRPIVTQCSNDPSLMGMVGGDLGDSTELVRSWWFERMMEKWCGSGNRLAFIDPEGITIINPEKKWSKTTFGMTVSNDYAYTCCNPTKSNTTYLRSNNYNGYGGQYTRSQGWYAMRKWCSEKNDWVLKPEYRAAQEESDVYAKWARRNKVEDTTADDTSNVILLPSSQDISDYGTDLDGDAYGYSDGIYDCSVVLEEPYDGYDRDIKHLLGPDCTIHRDDRDLDVLVAWIDMGYLDSEMILEEAPELYHELWMYLGAAG